jgi:ubiquinone/menaquinone biosynthesis C-methylase UbiE
LVGLIGLIGETALMAPNLSIQSGRTQACAADFRRFRAQLNRSQAISMSDTDKVFTGSIPKLYDTYLVPLIFEPYAADLVNRLSSRSLSRVLEIAAGTGVVTRALASLLPKRASIVATDLNQAMLDQASVVGTKRAVEWRQADAMQLPFPDGTFDAVVCQFGVMFFPEKPKAFSEARRVLRPGGVFIFNVWDRIEENEFADTVTTALESLFPKDPPRFMARTPHGYHDHRIIERDLASGGFTASPGIDTVAARSRATSSRIPAIAYCQGTPLRNEIETRDASRLGEATDIAAEAIGKRFGRGAVDGKIQAHIVTVES